MFIEETMYFSLKGDKIDGGKKKERKKERNPHFKTALINPTVFLVGRQFPVAGFCIFGPCIFFFF